MKFKDTVDEVVYTEDPYYDIFDGGYIDPEKVLADASSINEVLKAIDAVQTFLGGCIDNGFVEVC